MHTHKQKCKNKQNSQYDKKQKYSLQDFSYFCGKM